jgi:hypothetical protein
MFEEVVKEYFYHTEAFKCHEVPLLRVSSHSYPLTIIVAEEYYYYYKHHHHHHHYYCFIVLILK